MNVNVNPASKRCEIQNITCTAGFHCTFVCRGKAVEASKMIQNTTVLLVGRQSKLEEGEGRKRKRKRKDSKSHFRRRLKQAAKGPDKEDQTDRKRTRPTSSGQQGKEEEKERERLKEEVGKRITITENGKLEADVCRSNTDPEQKN